MSRQSVGGTPGHAEGSDSVKVCESPKVAGIPDQIAPFHTFDLDNYLTYGGSLPVIWSASAPPAGWTVAIDGNNVVTVKAPVGASNDCGSNTRLVKPTSTILIVQAAALDRRLP